MGVSKKLGVVKGEGISQQIGTTNISLPTPVLRVPLKDDLSFINGAGSATFTRSTIGTFVDKVDRVVKTAAIDAARFEDDGFLLEGASTNLLLRSEEFDNASWVKSGDASVTANSDVSPDGATTADKITSANWATSANNVQQNTTNRPLGEQTYSVFVKKVDTAEVRVRTIFDNSPVIDASSIFNFDTGVFSSVAASHTVEVFAITDGWFRLCVTIDITDAGFGSQIRLGGNTGAGSILLWGAQLEELSFATSYIKTVAASVTRTGELLTAPITFDSRNSYTVALDGKVLGKAAGSIKRYMFLALGTSFLQANLVDTGTGSVQFNAGTTAFPGKTWNDGTAFNKVVCIRNVEDDLGKLFIERREGVNAGLGATPANNTGTIFIGSTNIGEQIYGHIVDFRAYDLALTDAQAAVY